VIILKLIYYLVQFLAPRSLSSINSLYGFTQFSYNLMFFAVIIYVQHVVIQLLSLVKHKVFKLLFLN